MCVRGEEVCVGGQEVLLGEQEVCVRRQEVCVRGLGKEAGKHSFIKRCEIKWRLLQEAINLLEPMTNDPVNYVRQGALIASALIMIQQSEVTCPKVSHARPLRSRDRSSSALPWSPMGAAQWQEKPVHGDGHV